MFVLNSDITIGNFRFSGVQEVQVARSMYNISDSATIKIPSVSKIVRNGKADADVVITGKQFNDGDPVTIKLGYNSELQTEFQGFVRRRNLDMPLIIECEGYCWLLRRNMISNFWESISIKDLLNAAVSGIDAAYKIDVQCDVDYELSNVNISNATGFEVISNISKYTDGALSCFFIQPDVLWCGLVYTAYANGTDVFDLGLVNYRLGFNLVKGNTLNERLLENDPVEVKYSKKLSDGSKILEASDVFKNFVRTHSKILNQLNDADTLKALANEKAYRINYAGYEGNIKAFLQPYATPGYQAYIADDRYPERNGTYLVEGTEVNFGINGATRFLEIGPQMGFANQ